ncbi:hypothetical protein C6V80_09630 [Caminibacter pacificus]|uniref:Uncharacterized protein n=1 Tax=Caminibacter pacificus TaxID=1424653 RepID=A0ABX5VWT2_9BACT|nr:hypothetical protein C6V80_09630 [Caminibacter pacificus]
MCYFFKLFEIFFINIFFIYLFILYNLKMFIIDFLHCIFFYNFLSLRKHFYLFHKLFFHHRLTYLNI